MSAQKCRGVEKQMEFAAAAGGIKEGDKLVLSPERCLDVSNLFLRQWTWFKGGTFREIIQGEQFSNEEIKIILKKISQL